MNSSRALLRLTCTLSRASTPSSRSTYHTQKRWMATRMTIDRSTPMDVYWWGAGSNYSKYSRYIPKFLVNIVAAIKARSKVPGASALGDESLRPVLIPCPDPRPDTWIVDMAIGDHHALILTNRGDVYSFGAGPYFELGHGREIPHPELKPRKVEGLPPIKQVSCGTHHSVALTETGDVYAWGWAGHEMNPGAVGAGPEDAPSPKKLMRVKDIVQIASGTFHNVAVDASGDMFSWGRGAQGRLGNGGDVSRAQPGAVSVKGGEKIVRVSCGSNFSAAVSEKGKLYAWGSNGDNQLGMGSAGPVEMYSLFNHPIPVTHGSFKFQKTRSVSCGAKAMVIVTENSRVWQTGDRQFLIPNLVVGDDQRFGQVSVVDAVAGRKYAAAFDNHGHLFTWGLGNTCCLGHGSRRTYLHPTRVAGFGPHHHTANEFGPVVRAVATNTKLCVFTKRPPGTNTGNNTATTTTTTTSNTSTNHSEPTNTSSTSTSQA